MSKAKTIESFTIPPDYSRTALVRTIQNKRRVVLMRFQADTKPDLFIRWQFPKGKLVQVDRSTFVEQVTESIGGGA